MLVPTSMNRFIISTLEQILSTGQLVWQGPMQRISIHISINICSKNYQQGKLASTLLITIGQLPMQRILIHPESRGMSLLTILRWCLENTFTFTKEWQGDAFKNDHWSVNIVHLTLHMSVSMESRGNHLMIGMFIYSLFTQSRSVSYWNWEEITLTLHKSKCVFLGSVCKLPHPGTLVCTLLVFADTCPHSPTIWVALLFH